MRLFLSLPCFLEAFLPSGLSRLGENSFSSLKKTDCGVDGEDEVGLVLVSLFCFLLDIVSVHFRSDFNISQQCSY